MSEKEKTNMRTARASSAPAHTKYDTIQITRRRLSELAAGTLIVGFAVFMVGYFIGEHSAMEQLVQKMESNSFADQVYSSLYTGVTGTPVDEQSAHGVPIAVAGDMSSVAKPSGPVQHHAHAEVFDEPGDYCMSGDLSRRHYAQLMSFSSEDAAQQFAQRICSRGIPVEVKERVGKAANGAIRTWFQVITARYDSREQLEKVVSNLTKDERLKGVCIVTS